MLVLVLVLVVVLDLKKGEKVIVEGATGYCGQCEGICI
jgi:hypothetical protein